MERKALIDMLNDLIQLDVDAVEAYHQVIKHIEYHDMKTRFLDFQDDHKNHIQNLSALLQQLDAKPIKPSPDFKGYLMEGFTALMSVAGSMAALEAMQMNEHTTNKKYGEAAALDMPPDIMTVIKNHLSQEQRHLRYIQQVIETPRHELT